MKNMYDVLLDVMILPGQVTFSLQVSVRNAGPIHISLKLLVLLQYRIYNEIQSLDEI